MKNTKHLLPVTAFVLSGLLSIGFAGCAVHGTGYVDEYSGPVKVSIETINLSGKSKLSLNNYAYEVYCQVPPRIGETWTADLKFDDKDVWTTETDKVTGISYNKLIPGEFAYLETSAKDTALNRFLLCVLDPTDAGRSGTLTVTYSSGFKLEIALEQKAKGENAIAGGAEGRKARGIGYGYNAFLGYASEECIKSPIFRIAKMEDGLTLDDDEEIQIVYSKRKSNITYREESGSNIAELEKSLNMEANASLDFGAFSAELESSFKSEQKKNTNYQFAWFDTLVTTHTASIDGDKSQFSNKAVLQPGAYRAINNTEGDSYYDDFKNVILNYGTHVLVGGRLGGKLHVQMAADTSKITTSYDAGAMIKAGYQGLVLDASGKIDSKYADTVTKENNSFDFKVTVEGGSKNKIVTNEDGTEDDGEAGTQASISSMLTSRTVDSAITEAWVKSIGNIRNCVFIDFNNFNLNLIPIYELVDRKREGGQERYEKFKQYWENDMKHDVELLPKKQSSYVTSAPAVIKIPTDWADTGSLVKDVYLDGTLMARITSEYIPDLNKQKRVTVVYPATNDKVYYNMGYFIGDSTHKPHGVSWEGGKTVLNEKLKELPDKVEYGSVTKLYIKTLGMTAREPDYFSNQTVFTELEVKDYVLNAGNNGTYNVVKIFDHYYTRDYWNGTYCSDGTPYSTYKTKDGEGRNKNGLQYYSDGVYSNNYKEVKQDHGGFAADNWYVPVGDYLGDVIKALKGLTGTKPDGTVANSFLKGGVLGLNLRNKTGYVNSTNSIDDGDTSILGCISMDTYKAGEKTNYNENRIVISEASGEALYLDNSDIGIWNYWFPLILCHDL